MNKIVTIVLFSILWSNCTTPKQTAYTATDKSYKQQANAYSKLLAAYPLQDSSGYSFVGTTNFNMRKPNFVIIHHTAQNSCEQTLKTFTLTRTQVSAHYVVCKEGNVYHMLNDYLRAWHGGAAKWGNVTDINSSSIGIELDNNGTAPFSDAQINALVQLLQRLKNAYSIPVNNFIGHADIAPDRKNDPSKFFPWQTLAQKGYGVWYDTTNVTVPQNFDYKVGLRLIGYNTKNEKAALKAFKLHFINSDTTVIVNDATTKIIYSLAQQTLK